MLMLLKHWCCCWSCQSKLCAKIVWKIFLEI